jgi:hypothetical protein
LVVRRGPGISLALAAHATGRGGRVAGRGSLGHHARDGQGTMCRPVAPLAWAWPGERRVRSARR